MEPKIEVRLVTNPRMEAADAQIVVCTRVTELPIPFKPATIEHCPDCGERVWLANSSPRGVKLMCYQCIEPTILAEMDKGEEVIISMTKDTANHLLRGGKV